VYFHEQVLTQVTAGFIHWKSQESIRLPGAFVTADILQQIPGKRVKRMSALEHFSVEGDLISDE
jgi:hypothetical protein